MSFLDSQSEAWDSAHWEFTLVFEDLANEDLWRRAHPSLLSIGELVAHMTYSQVEYANQVDPEANLESLLHRAEARYYLHAVDAPMELEMGVEALAAEFDRVQKITKAVFLASTASRQDPLTFRGPGRTFGEFADYMIFHVAYHTGQAFSVRHLMGHKTNDN